MKVLIDADILLYEVGFGVNTGWKGESVPPFDYAAELMDGKIRFIENQIKVFFGVEEVSTKLFITGGVNFRAAIAKRKGYKENRKESVKPFHYNNLKAYVQNAYECVVTDGIEADDAVCIERAKDIENSIACSRDKDLRQHEGWIYSWEVGKQPSFGPFRVEGYGEISLEKKGKANILKGYGQKFFLSQVLTGDIVDNYPGLPGCGPVEAFSTLQATLTYPEGLKAVVEAYRALYGDSWEQELEEQAQLAYILKDERMWRLNEQLHS